MVNIVHVPPKCGKWRYRKFTEPISSLQSVIVTTNKGGLTEIRRLTPRLIYTVGSAWDDAMTSVRTQR